MKHRAYHDHQDHDINIKMELRQPNCELMMKYAPASYMGWIDIIDRKTMANSILPPPVRSI